MKNKTIATVGTTTVLVGFVFVTFVANKKPAMTII